MIDVSGKAETGGFVFEERWSRAPRRLEQACQTNSDGRGDKSGVPICQGSALSKPQPAGKQKARRGRRCAGLPKLTGNREEEVLPVPPKERWEEECVLRCLNYTADMAEKQALFRSAALRIAHSCGAAVKDLVIL